MPKFVIERAIPGAGKLSREKLHAISQKSCGVLRDLGPSIQMVRRHAVQGGFPADSVARVRAVMDPTTAE